MNAGAKSMSLSLGDLPLLILITTSKETEINSSSSQFDIIGVICGVSNFSLNMFESY